MRSRSAGSKIFSSNSMAAWSVRIIWVMLGGWRWTWRQRGSPHVAFGTPFAQREAGAANMSLRASLYPGVIAIVLAASGVTFLVREPAMARPEPTPVAASRSHFVTASAGASSGMPIAGPAKAKDDPIGLSPVGFAVTQVAGHSAVSPSSSAQPQMRPWLLTLGGGLLALLLAWRRLSD